MVDSVTFNTLLLSSFPKGGADEPRLYPDGDSMRDTESGATSENSVMTKLAELTYLAILRTALRRLD
jgi:hypothetical protein